MILVNTPWLAVTRPGSHIKSTPTHLIIQVHGDQDEIPLKRLRHLLIIGNHNLHTSVIYHLMKAGSAISFFDREGKPIGFLSRFGDREDDTVQTMQRRAGRYKYAVMIARTALKSRLLVIERTIERSDMNLLYEGEEALLYSSLDEIEYLIKPEEIQRLHRLTRDMYYEIIARSLPSEHMFRQRTPRPQRDPVNAMLTIGYAMLVGNCLIHVIGSHLDPDGGMLHEGKASLVLDLIEPLKAGMVDKCVFSIARDVLRPKDYECSTSRCYLSDELITHLTAALHKTIKEDVIGENVLSLYNSVMKNSEYQIPYW